MTSASKDTRSRHLSSNNVKGDSENMGYQYKTLYNTVKRIDQSYKSQDSNDFGDGFIDAKRARKLVKQEKKNIRYERIEGNIDNDILKISVQLRKKDPVAQD